MGPPTKLIKSITVDVAVDTWPSPSSVPANLRGASGTSSIDLTKALLMLGTLTMPNLLSPASPALFWAWLRYYLAPVEGIDDLRITMDFSDLDSHQKGILSDDFGVAISTQWLFDGFGGFTDIVDGRDPQRGRSGVSVVAIHRDVFQIGPAVEIVGRLRRAEVASPDNRRRVTAQGMLSVASSP